MRVHRETGIFQTSQKIWLPCLCPFLHVCLINEFVAGWNKQYTCISVLCLQLGTLYCLLDRNFVVPVRART